MQDMLNSDVVGILLALLPGFLTAEVLSKLVVREDRSVFDRVIQALIFTFLAHLTWVTVGWPKGALPALGMWSIVWALVLTWIINSDHVHQLLRKVHLTKAASRPSEWYDAFYNSKAFVVLHLVDGRRLFGWPRIYTFRSDKGHLLIEDAEWLDRRDEGGMEIPLVDLLINVNDVRFVEFVPCRVSSDRIES